MLEHFENVWLLSLFTHHGLCDFLEEHVVLCPIYSLQNAYSSPHPQKRFSYLETRWTEQAFPSYPLENL